MAKVLHFSYQLLGTGERDTITALQQHPLFAGVAPEVRGQLLAAAQELHVDSDALITRQNYPADNFYILLAGSVQFFIQADETGERSLVGSADQAWTPLGWSGLNSPHRYATTIYSTQPCRVLVWSRERLQNICERHPEFTVEFFRYILHASVELLRDACCRLLQSAYTVDHSYTSDDITQYPIPDPELGTVHQWLKEAPFFEVFSHRHLFKLSSLGEERSVTVGAQASEIGLGPRKKRIIQSFLSFCSASALPQVLHIPICATCRASNLSKNPAQSLDNYYFPRPLGFAKK